MHAFRSAPTTYDTTDHASNMHDPSFLEGEGKCKPSRCVVHILLWGGVEACKHSCILHSYRRAGFQLDHGLMSTSDNKHVYTNAPSPDGHP